QVGHVVEAAAAVEAGTFYPRGLDPVGGRGDELGNLARGVLRGGRGGRAGGTPRRRPTPARVVGRMAREGVPREERLQREVRELRIEIDGARAARKVQEITETDYFKTLERKVADLRLKGEG